MTALIVSANGFEDSTLLVPLYRLQEHGTAITVASTERGLIRGERGYEVEATRALHEIDPGDYDLVVLPGGTAPAALQREKAALDLVRVFCAEGKPLAAICHGPQLLAAAGVLQRRRVTCFSTLAGEMRAAGADYENQEVVVDGNLVTSRKPSDLPAFMRETIKLMDSYRRNAFR